MSLDAFLLAFARTLPVVALHPVFGGRAVPRSVLVGVAATLALAVATNGRIASSPGSAWFAALAVGHVLSGTAIGLVGRSVFGTPWQ